jgi:uncharacterized protein YndB with AHSA1/START domain
MTLLLLIVGLLVGFFVLAIVLGKRLAPAHAAASRIFLSAPPAEVWQIITDFPAYPSWRPGLVAIERGPLIDGHESWYEVCSRHGKIHYEVVEVEPNRRLITRLVGENLPLKSTWNYELAEHAGGTRLTITESAQILHPIFRFFSKYILTYHGAMDVFLIALANKLGDKPEPEHLAIKQQMKA